METKNELRILNLFRKNLFIKTSIREIMLRLKSRSYQRIFEAVKNLVKKNILCSERIGNTNIISAKMSRESILNLAFLDEQEGLEAINSRKILDIKEITKFIVLITGSYARGNYTKKSDMDLVVIVPNNEDVVALQKKIENLTMLFVPSIHLYVFRENDFIEMLTDNKDNYGKEIMKNKLVLKNGQRYYELIKEAVEHGYKG